MNSQSLISTPALGLGTSRLGHYYTEAKAQLSLDLAYNLGITYFDTAPIYAYGWSEKLLGTFVRNKRDKVQIATKIGLQPSRILSLLPFKVLGSLRNFAKTIRKENTSGMPVGVSNHLSISFDPIWAMQSLEGSLRRMKTDYVDVLLLHESTIREANAPETKQFMDQVIQSGKAKAIGIGSALDKLTNINTLDPSYTIVQHEYDLLNNEPFIPGDRMVNTHGLFQNIKRMKSLAQEVWFQQQMGRICALDFSMEPDMLQFCLAGARYEHPNGITLFSSTNEEHIKATIASWHNIAITQQQFKEAISILRKHSQAS